MSALADLDRVHLTSSMEHRDDRPYDQQDPCTVVHPNGTLMRVGNGPGLAACHLAAAITREVLVGISRDLWVVEKAADA